MAIYSTGEMNAKKFGIPYNMGYRTNGGLGSGYGDGIIIRADNTLPIYETIEHNFYRVVLFNENFYGKTVSELQSGNLRPLTIDNRYSDLLLGTKVSYWANNPKVAKAEVFQHYKCSSKDRNYLMFWAYDDASSIFPILPDCSLLCGVDGTRLQFSDVLHKIDRHEQLSENDLNLLKYIKLPDIDFLAYTPHAIDLDGGVNYVFSETGFKKLSIRAVSLYIHGRKRNTIECAFGSDFSPCKECYDYCFEKIARICKKQ